jgi:tRNA pseudouridine32 synthase/23S rRNA pseudouridine746 synthase
VLLTISVKDPFFTSFEASIESFILPDRFTFTINNKPHSLCFLAAKNLQIYLENQKDWIHNFGLSLGEAGPVIGKMFGILIVKTEQNEIGYLAAFSGKLAGRNHHSRFVPPVFDMLTENSFLNNGMAELTRMNEEIRILEELKGSETNIDLLKTERKNYSASLQNELFDHYHFLNKAGEEKSLNTIFRNASYKNPPSGAGECAGPKLLQYAFQNKMKPIAIAEFWWGSSPKSDHWKHGYFYPCCREKCEPILAHMLEGIDDN